MPSQDYFSAWKKYADAHFHVTEYAAQKADCTVRDILGFGVNDAVRRVYETYASFSAVWFSRQEKYLGCTRLIGYDRLMQECYDMDADEYEIAEDIQNWYPLFRFGNGDAFCLDIRNGAVVFFEHDVVDDGQNLHGLRIADSVNDLFDKWSRIHFADYCYWDEITDAHGIDLDHPALKAYL